MRQIAYRPFDIRWIYDDPAWIDWYREDLHAVMDEVNTEALVTIPNDHGRGPAVVVADRLMDQHFFRGSDGGNGVFFVWRPRLAGERVDPRAIRGDQRSGFSTRVFDWLDGLGRGQNHDSAFSYVCAVLSAPSYTRRFWRALETDELRVPLTDDPAVFDNAAFVGALVREAWISPPDSKPGIGWKGSGTGPLGAPKFVRGDSGSSDSWLEFKNGCRIEGVTRQMWDFEVSGYKVLQRWFKAREHWTISTGNAREALRAVIGVSELVALESRLDSALESVLASGSTG